MAQEIKKAILKSSEDEIFEVDLAVAFESETLKQLIEDTGAESVLPLPNVTGKILAKVIEFCKYHVEADKIIEEKAAISKKDVENWEQDFVKVDLETLFDLILAANFLNIKNLLELTCQTVADMMKGKTPEEIREIFNIQNDYTPEEEAEVRRENQWAFE